MSGLKFKQWKDMQLAVGYLNSNSSPRDLLDVILSWLRNNHDLCFFKPFSDYGFDKFVKVNEGEMPVDFSNVTANDILHFKSILMRYGYRDKNEIARFLRDVLEELIVFEVDKQCPVCESWGMKVLVGEVNGVFAHQCKVCTYVRYLDGSDVNGDNLIYPCVNKLCEAGFLK